MKDGDVRFTIVRQMGEISLDGVFVYSLLDNMVVYANSNAHELAGVKQGNTRDDIEATLQIVVPQDRAYVTKEYTDLAEKRMSSEFEFRLVARNGKQTVLCCTAYVVENRSAVIVFIKDITLAKSHENYLVDYGTRKNTILDTLAHQISGALTLMRHLSEEAEKYVQDTHDRNLKVFLGLLVDNSIHSLDIIDNLLVNEHQDSPQILVKNSRVDVVSKVSIICEELQKSFPRRKFAFVSSVVSRYMDVDAIKLLQIVNNLTSNAIKFSREDQEIVVEIAETETEVIFVVKDQGIGIPEELKSGIFKTQFAVGRTGLQGERSIGLGLSICKNLVQMMKGRIWFDSEVGVGSSFYFSLPKG